MVNNYFDDPIIHYNPKLNINLDTFKSNSNQGGSNQILQTANTEHNASILSLKSATENQILGKRMDSQNLSILL